MNHLEEEERVSAGILSSDVSASARVKLVHNLEGMRYFRPFPRYYRHLLAFIFAIDEINKNTDILPNQTLGYHALDSCGDANLAVSNVIQILSGATVTVPNYSCGQHGQLAGVIGDLSSQTSTQIANVLRSFGYPQISFGATDPILANKQLYPSFFQTLYNDRVQCLAIIKLLKHFGWTWVGILTSDDDSGEAQSREIQRLANENGICIEFILKSQPKQSFKIIKTNKQILRNSTSQILVICGSVSLWSAYIDESEGGDMYKKTVIIPASWTLHFHGDNSSISLSTFNGSLVFTRSHKSIPTMQDFFENINFMYRPTDTLLEEIWAAYFSCETSNSDWNWIIEYTYGTRLHNCSMNRNMTEFASHLYNSKSFGTPYQVYKAVYAMAHALNDFNMYMERHSKRNSTWSHKRMREYFLKRVRFKDPTGEDVYFNKNGEMTNVYHIQNYVISRNGAYFDQLVGTFSVSSEGERLTINDSEIIWKYGTTEIPRSRCSDDCPPGHRRVLRKGKHTCCFDCVLCSEGEISNQTDGGSCTKCPDDQWPNETKEKCVEKPTEYLSYKTDLIAIALSTITVFLFVISANILGIFILYGDTPIVKANNRNLSFILLVSIMLSDLSVLLFPGHPTDATCMLRQTSFGIIFSVAVSSLLAKTIMVCIAFKATKPGSTWRKWIGVKIPNCVVFVCSFIQIVISICWLSISPPYQEMNTHSYPGKIIIQCNEGSVVAFYTVLGYMGFLAAVSFVVAFLARKLPDGFNETKYITFSMLIFCNVWISFIPAYMSVMGKNTVIVEIFAILASSSGILGCIFFPKCYIILFRPSLNKKGYLFKVPH
ncbi:vomeronasal type-2 receptor 26-like [Spea bombifrons]|uniref:vomeronasal type-2 receptor 26-like n=1 Tax=Spea bombifrons TaxID=233779 RepID=UPI002348FCB0|nr:vomeronasal type-2 receptor 26-like [Spea bombifrons]